MTYQVLARKWRPQDFTSLVGQEPIVTALSNALVERRIAQAYLFSGIRGVGKTTAARVFAKALNCERKPGSEERKGADPCNECKPCREITSGADIDVLEIDAATYSKVEQIRELTESLRYGAANSRYKVVVLDEVHRLSRQAFDALLKIVEEPPPHLIFIFATTEIDAVPATILSRCQEFQFRRVPSPVLAAHLGRIAEAESISVSEAALRMIARSGEGSVRDSVALLDQLATFGNGEISDQDANRLLGGLDADIFRRLLSGVLTGEHQVITEIVREIEENGWDPHHVYTQFLSYVRDALHLVLGGRPESIDLPLEEAQALADLVRETGHESLLQLAHLLLAGEMAVKRSEFALLALEITWLRAAELPKVTRLEDVLSGKVPVSVPVEGASNVASAPAPAPRQAVARPENLEPATEKPTQATSTPAGAVCDSIQQLKTLLSRRPPLSARFNDDVRLEFEDGTLLIHCSNDTAELSRALERKANAEFFAEALKDIWGPGSRYEVRDDGRSSEAAPVQEAESAPKTRDIPKAKSAPKARETPKTTAARTEQVPSAEDLEKYESHWAVKAVRDIYGGRIGNVKPRQAGDLKT